MGRPVARLLAVLAVLKNPFPLRLARVTVMPKGDLYANFILTHQIAALRATQLR